MDSESQIQNFGGHFTYTVVCLFVMSISSCKYDTENHLWQTTYFFSVNLQSYFCCFIAVFSCTYNWSISTIQLRYVKAFQKILKHVYFCKHHKDTRAFYVDTKTDFRSSHFGVNVTPQIYKKVVDGTGSTHISKVVILDLYFWCSSSP